MGARAAGNGIVLQVYRGGLVSSLRNPSRYVISANGLGEVSMSLPSELGDEPEWSPDGQWVVFSTLYTEGARARGNSEIYLMRSNGGQSTRLSDHPRDDFSPTWSRDGTRIAYVAGANINTVNVQCILSGQECHPRPTILTQGDQPNWSPDGRRLVYAHFRLEEGIYVIDTDANSSPMNLASNLKSCRYPRWSPDGQRIVFECLGGIFVVNSDGSGLRKIIEGGGNPSWSPDGRKIVFVSSRYEGLGKPLNAEGSIRSDALFLADADGNNIVRLSKRDDESILWYAWLPPGANRP